MGVVFLILKVFPVFGGALAVLFFDFARSFRRKGNKIWIGFVLLAVLMIALTVVWFVLRGDRNAELWFARFLEWVRAG